jgi:hypothetical protein
MSSMGITVRVYSVGSDREEEMPLEAAANGSWGSIVWVDADREEASLAGSRAAWPRRWIPALSRPTRPSLRATTSVSRSGTTRQAQRPRGGQARYPARAECRHLRHDDPIRGGPIDTVAGTPLRPSRRGRFPGLLLDGILDGYDAAVSWNETSTASMRWRSAASSATRAPDGGGATRRRAAPLAG